MAALVYLSAQERLKQQFPGKRLMAVQKRYSSSMTNFWPYLRARQREVADRKSFLRESFLGQALRKQLKDSAEKVISEELWGGSDNERQLAIAFRHVTERFTHLV